MRATPGGNTGSRRGWKAAKQQAMTPERPVPSIHITSLVHHDHESKAKLGSKAKKVQTLRKGKIQNRSINLEGRQAAHLPVPASSTSILRTSVVAPIRERRTRRGPNARRSRVHRVPPPRTPSATAPIRVPIPIIRRRRGPRGIRVRRGRPG